METTCYWCGKVIKVIEEGIIKENICECVKSGKHEWGDGCSVCHRYHIPFKELKDVNGKWICKDCI